MAGQTMIYNRRPWTRGAGEVPGQGSRGGHVCNSDNGGMRGMAGAGES